MKKIEIRTQNAPLPVGPYSQAVRVGDLLFVSGVLPMDLNTKTIVQNTEQAVKLIFSHLEGILQEAGIDKNSVVKSTIFMKDLSEFSELNKHYALFFEGTQTMPARSTVQVAKLPLDAPVEMEFIATF